MGFELLPRGCLCHRSPRNSLAEEGHLLIHGGGGGTNGRFQVAPQSGKKLGTQSRVEAELPHCGLG